MSISGGSLDARMKRSNYTIELDSLQEEWKEARATIDRFDNITVDIRKYGFSLIALIISSSTIIFDAASITNPLPLIIVPIVVEILTLGVYLADNYYQVLLLSAILHARQLENVHKELLSHHIKHQIYFGWNLTNYIEDKVQKSRSYLNTFVIYVLFLLVSFLMGYLSLISYQMNLGIQSILRYLLTLIGSFLFGLLFLGFTSRYISKLLTEMRETEMIDNRFVIRKVFDREAISSATQRLADRIYNHYKDINFKVLTLGMGGLYFANNLIGFLKRKGMINVEIISAFSKRSGDDVTIQPPQESDVRGENILIVDDLVSTGITIKTAVEVCEVLGARTVKTCTLLDAPNKRLAKAADFVPDFVGLYSPEKKRFFVGSGLDGGNKMSEHSRNQVRHLPYIGVIIAPLDEEIISIDTQPTE